MQLVNGVSATIVFLLVDEQDDESAETGLTGITTQISKNGGAFAATTNSATEIGNGFYKVVLTTTELNQDGHLAFIASKTGADVYRALYIVYTPATTINATVTGINQATTEFLADAILRRNYANAKARSSGSGVDALNFRSLLGAVAKDVNKIVMSDVTLTIYHEDDSTSFATQTATTNSGAVPVTALDTN